MRVFTAGFYALLPSLPSFSSLSLSYLYGKPVMDQHCHISREKSVERLFMVSSVVSALSALGMEFRASGILSTPSRMPRSPPFLFTPSWGFFSRQSWSSLKSWQKESGLWKIEYSGNLRHRILGWINLIL